MALERKCSGEPEKHAEGWVPGRRRMSQEDGPDGVCGRAVGPIKKAVSSALNFLLT